MRKHMVTLYWLYLLYEKSVPFMVLMEQPSESLSRLRDWDIGVNGLGPEVRDLIF